MRKFVKDAAGVWHRQPYALPVRPPLMPHQIDGIAWMIERSNCLHAGEPGVGKTAQIIGVINSLPLSARVLILAPSGLRANWLRELAIWLTVPRRCAIAKRYIPEVPVVVLQFDALAKFEVQLRRVEWDLIVMDEVHALKNADSIKARQVLGDTWTPRLSSARRIIASATPMINRPAELWPLLAILGVKIGRDDFTRQFCYDHNQNGCRDPDGLRALLAPIMLRQLKSECLNLLAKMRRIVAIEPSGDLAANIAIEEKWQAETEKAGHFAGGVAMKRLAALRIRNALDKVALPAVRARLLQTVQEEGKLVIFCHHDEVIEAVAALFPAGSAVAYSGKHSPRQRTAAIDRFQNDPSCSVFVGSIGTAGIGVTLTAARRLVFIEYAWSEALMEQAADRIHRIGQRRPVLIEYFVIAGSVDARSIQLQVEKQATIDAVYGSAA